MKKLILSVMAALMILPAATAFAAPQAVTVEKSGPYEGTFHGVVYGDNGSSAPLSLQLTHRDDDVQGSLAIGSGLYVKGGVCGGAYVPSGVQYASGKTDPRDSSHLVASAKVDVDRFDITVRLESDVSPSGDVIQAKAKLDLPWFCGRDPVLDATLYRSN
jgi:hypothetical protein